MIIGGLYGSVQREVQELRDALTEELVDAESTPLTDDGLALDVFSWLRRVPDLKAKIIAPASPLPEATDAMLYVKFGGVAIDVQGRDAVITTTGIPGLAARACSKKNKPSRPGMRRSVMAKEKGRSSAKDLTSANPSSAVPAFETS